MNINSVEHGIHVTVPFSIITRL